MGERDRIKRDVRFKDEEIEIINDFTQKILNDPKHSEQVKDVTVEIAAKELGKLPK